MPWPVHVPTTVGAGELFSLVVLAADAARIFDPSYRGTVSFSSTDPAASLPLPYTFTTEDSGRKAFPAVLRGAGPQTITVTDSTGLMPGSLTLTVVGTLSDIPALTLPFKIGLALLLAVLGFWFLGSNRGF